MATKKKRHVRMAVIPKPEPNTRTVINYTGEGTVAMRGSGQVVLECGNCGEPIVDGLAMTQVRNLVFKCNNCGEYNETLA